MNDIDSLLGDTIIERPRGFSAGDGHFFLYPLTLGKMYAVQPLIDALDINRDILQANVSAEALRLASEKRDMCLEVIALYTCRTKDEVFDPAFQDKRKSELKGMSSEDIAVLLIVILTSDKTEQFIRHLKLDREHEDMKKVMDVKNRSDKNTYNFGGLTVYGSFIAPLMEMGMSWDEILWERSYTNLRLLLADKMNSIYLSDDERKQVHITKDRNRINGDDRAAIMDAIKSQSWD